MSSPTIKDVAKLAGVSISTVSRVMNNSKPVSTEAKMRVLDAIEKLDFKPNELARSLVMKRSNLIGVVVKDIGIPYMANIIRGIEEIGRMYKYDILLTSGYGELEKEKDIIDFLFTKQVEGIIFVSENINPEVLIKIKNYKIPYMEYDKFSEIEDANTVIINHKKAMYELTEYLINYGHEKILLVKEYERSKISKDKALGYKKAMGEHKLKVYEYLVDGVSIQDGYNSGEDIVNLIDKEGIKAVVVSEDEIALGFMNYCYDIGRIIPDYISVVGFGNCSMSSIYRPTLTTANEPYYDIGAILSRRLIKTLKKEETVKGTTTLPFEIIERNSVKEYSFYKKTERKNRSN